MVNCYWVNLFVYLCFLHTSESLKCYECTSFFTSVDCSDSFDPSGVNKVDCSGSEVCMTHVLPELSNAPEIFQRGCVDKYYCSNIDALSGHCITCQEDLCNSSTPISNGGVIFVLLFVILLCMM